jgi:hypothetical protein
MRFSTDGFFCPEPTKNNEVPQHRLQLYLVKHNTILSLQKFFDYYTVEFFLVVLHMAFFKYTCMLFLVGTGTKIINF